MAIDLWNNNVMKWTCFPKDAKNDKFLIIWYNLMNCEFLLTPNSQGGKKLSQFAVMSQSDWLKMTSSWSFDTIWWIASFSSPLILRGKKLSQFAVMSQSDWPICRYR